MRYLSVCSGIEAASVAWEPLGLRAVAFAEIDPFASAVLAHRFPDVPNLGDFTKIGKDDIGTVDLLVGGTPCFVAGTLIVSERGLVPIEQIVVGDRVLTHEGRYQPVTAVGAKLSPTIRMRGQGIDVVTTENHRFWSQRTISRSTRVGGVAVRQKCQTDTAWTVASELVGAHVATPKKFPALKVPPIERIGREANPPFLDENLAWVIGAWLGDGWTRKMDCGRAAMLICAARGPQSVELHERLKRVFGNVTKTVERTTDRFTVYAAALVRWLRAEFGSGAFGKTLPTWALGLSWELRRALLGGYLFADGSTMPSGRRFTTVSPTLALGFSMLAHSLGFSTTRYRYENLAETTVIDGRTVNQRPFFQVNIYDRARSSYENGIHRFGLVRSIASTGRVEKVFDLTVSGDHSYVANGSVAHNCQDFSVAGLRAGLGGDRGQLTIEFLRLAERTRAEWLVWENVPGVLSADGGRAFGAFLGLLGKLGYGFAYRVLDAQYFGVPQRRRRVFVVGCFGDWRRAAAVLFERASLSGDSPPSRKTGAIASALTRDGLGGGGADDNLAQGNHLIAPSLTRNPYGDKAAREGLLVAHTLKAEGFDASEDGTGRGVPLIAAALPILEPTARTGISTTDIRSGDGIGSQGDPMFTLQAGKQHGVFVPVGEPLAFDTTNITSAENRANPQIGQPCHPLSAGAHAPAIAFALRGREEGAQPEVHQNGATVGGLRAASGGSSRDYVAASAVRRLTPRECERLQGFPDDFTLVPYRKKLAADGPRYRALGNSMAVPVMRWIGERIAQVVATEILKAS